MKVKELIEALKKRNPEYDVIVSGYEGGYRDISNFATKTILRDVNTEWYYGPHEIHDSSMAKLHGKGKEKSKAVILS